jgi:hypothetical protein
VSAPRPGLEGRLATHLAPYKCPKSLDFPPPPCPAPLLAIPRTQDLIPQSQSPFLWNHGYLSPGGQAATKELSKGFKHSVGAWALMVFREEMNGSLGLSCSNNRTWRRVRILTSNNGEISG